MTQKEYNNQISEFETTLPEAYIDYQDEQFAETVSYGMDFETWVKYVCPSFQKWKSEEMNQKINALIEEA